LSAVTAYTSVEPVGRAAGREPIEAEFAHLVFQRRKDAGVFHPVLFVQGGDRLGAQLIAAMRAHRRHRLHLRHVSTGLVVQITRALRKAVMRSAS
jgi:hypothetical protein